MQQPVTYCLAHDYFSQRGGAERVAQVIARGLSVDEVVTSVTSDSNHLDEQFSGTVRTSFLQQFRMFRIDPRRALALLPLAWEMLKAKPSDVVVCSSSGWSHGLKVSPSAVKIVYCHNPARWLYQQDDYFVDKSYFLRGLTKTISPLLRVWDRRAAMSANAYIANSTSVAARILAIYGIKAHVVYPPVSIDVDGLQQAPAGVGGEFFLSVGRPRGYKGVEHLTAAFDQMPTRRLVVVGDHSATDHAKNITFLGRVSEAELRWLYANARALVSVSKEDFGLTPIEANAFGTPALVVRAGGFLDSTNEGVSGSFIEAFTPSAVRQAVEGFRTNWDRDAIIRHAQSFSESAFIGQLRSVIEAEWQKRHFRHPE